MQGIRGWPLRREHRSDPQDRVSALTSVAQIRANYDTAATGVVEKGRRIPRQFPENFENDRARGNAESGSRRMVPGEERAFRANQHGIRVFR